MFAFATLFRNIEPSTVELRAQTRENCSSIARPQNGLSHLEPANQPGLGIWVCSLCVRGPMTQIDKVRAGRTHITVADLQIGQNTRTVVCLYTIL
jgi:hypothetical protein